MAQKNVMIGLETHIQLKTDSKIFCSCPTIEGEPNTNVCEICLGHPGSKPMFNFKVLQFALKLCVALGCTIESEIMFSRKTYFYPDMNKNFQITQYEIPLGKNGSVKLKDGTIVNIERIHIEEDPAALVHEGSIAQSPNVFIDYNRAGIPLCEIVTTPCMSTPAQAREYLKELLKIVKYLDIYDENSGVLKSDCNISIPGHPRAEIKNVSGFKDAEKALNYELVRQKIALKMKKKSLQETRAWDGKKTISLRSKESEADYGYIIEPDLTKQVIADTMIKAMKQEIPELAHQRSERYVKEHKLSSADAQVMAMELELAELFEKVSLKIDAKLAAKWLRRELLRVLNYNKKNLKQIKLDENHLIELLALVEIKTISETTGQKLMEQLLEKDFSPKEYVERKGLAQVSSESELKRKCLTVIAKNAKAVEDYRAGNNKSFHFLVGQVMRQTKGKADPAVVNRVMKRLV